MGGAPQLLNANGSINSGNSFSALLNGAIPANGVSFRGLFNAWSQQLQALQVSQNAVNNVTGDWYEWLIAICAWNYRIQNPPARIAVKLPNVTQLNIERLYIPRLQAFISDLRTKVQNAAQVTLISSNPDFVIINPAGMNLPPQLATPIVDITPLVLNTLDNAYSFFLNQCNFEQITGYMSVKASLRPDRRLQMPHEGSLMKALYTHLQTREWILDPPGINYYGISAAIGQADIAAMQTVATHSIITVQSLPVPAVDQLFQIDSVNDANAVFAQIL